MAQALNPNLENDSHSICALPYSAAGGGGLLFDDGSFAVVVFHMPKKRRGSAVQGFTLMEMAVVLVIVGLLLIFTLPVSNVVMSNQRRAATLQNLKNIQTALNNYVTVNKRLPCPADGSLAPPTGNATPVGAGPCTGNQAAGIVPWVTLGLTAAEARDAWFNQITYRVGFGLTRDVPPALDMSSCDPVGANPAVPGSPVSFLACLACPSPFVATSCTAPKDFLKNKGLNVTDGTNPVMEYDKYTGAAYILISHGDNGYGARTSAGVYVATAATGVAGNLENANLSTKTVANAAPPQFIDAPFFDANDATKYFDDIIIRPSLLSVINQAQLGPRSH